jgi:hypothetical protein
MTVWPSAARIVVVCCVGAGEELGGDGLGGDSDATDERDQHGREERAGQQDRAEQFDESAAAARAAVGRRLVDCGHAGLLVTD